jgi:hypothetical protein
MLASVTVLTILVTSGLATKDWEATAGAGFGRASGVLEIRAWKVFASSSPDGSTPAGTRTSTQFSSASRIGPTAATRAESESGRKPTVR